MLLIIDIGNTFIKWALTNYGESFNVENTNWGNSGVVRHHELIFLKDNWQTIHKKTPIKQIIISNVAGQNLRNTLFDYLNELNPKPQKIEWFYSMPSLLGIQNTYLDFRKLGSDRFASMIGAKALFPETALVIVTAGTATTIDTLSPDGIFKGGMILPGLKLMTEALAHNTAQLPEINQLENKAPYFANETNAAILSGCINAQTGAIERAVSAHQKHFNNVQCLLSGGAAKYIAPNLSIPCRIIDNLVLIGLYKVAA